MYHFIFLMEWVREELDPGPVPNGRYIRILDLHGLGFMDVVDRDVTYLVRELLGILDYYYPSRLAHTYIVNTPRFFGTLWRVSA